MVSVEYIEKLDGRRDDLAVAARLEQVGKLPFHRAQRVAFLPGGAGLGRFFL